MVLLNAGLGEEAFRMLEDGKLAAQICIALKVGKPSLLEWFAAPERADRFARARALAASSLVEETLAIADARMPVEIDGEKVYDHNRDTMRIKTRQWTAERMDRQAWGQQQNALTINLHGLHLNALRVQEPVPMVEEVDPQQQIEGR
jgi:hypothetical protein